MLGSPEYKKVFFTNLVSVSKATLSINSSLNNLRCEAAGQLVRGILLKKLVNIL